MTGIELIAAERQRQIEQEGWTDEHDDAHPAGELALAGMCYAGHASLSLSGHAQDAIPSPWPWSANWWKPADPLRDLVRAGALIAAEIDKLQRTST